MNDPVSRITEEWAKVDSPAMVQNNSAAAVDLVLPTAQGDLS